jgi:hypothetical protein
MNSNLISPRAEKEVKNSGIVTRRVISNALKTSRINLKDLKINEMIKK